MAYQLGIDFGTSATKIALRCDDMIPQALHIGLTEALYMPSVAAYRRTDGGEAELLTVGEDADQILDNEYTIVLRDIKRCLASRDASEMLPTDQCPSWWNVEESCVELWSSKLNPEDVILDILTEALKRAIDTARLLGIGDDLDSVSIRGVPTSIGCPVTARLDMRMTLADVARRLGVQSIRVRDVVEEPILASLSYSNLDLSISAERIVLVYDWGGGSFDTAIVRVRRSSPDGTPELTVLARDGETFCGGTDIDDAFAKYILWRVAHKILGLGPESNNEALDVFSREETQYVYAQIGRAHV